MKPLHGNWRLEFAVYTIGLLFLAASAGGEVVLDTSFGTNGVTWTSFGASNASDEPRDLLVQPDGWILTAGRSVAYTGERYVAISRHTPEGVLDSAGFGIDGKVYARWSFRDEADAIFLMEDGRIVAAGMQAESNSSGAQIESVYRFHGDGAADYAFGDSGYVAIRPMLGSSEHGGVKVLPDGTIFAGGRQNLSSPGLNVRKYLSDGTLAGGNLLDLGIGGPSPDPYNPSSCAFPDDGGIIVASTAAIDGFTQFVMVRFDGAMNAVAGFGVNGVVRTGVEATFNRPRRVIVLADGKILLVGTTPRLEGNTNWTALRFYGDGTPDSTFGINGRADITFGTTSFNVPYDAGIDAYGRILLAGRASGPQEAALARLLPDGSLDTTFSDDGKFAIDLNGGGGSHYFTRALVLPDGRILAAGYDFSSNSGDFFLARFLPSDVTGVGLPDTPPAARVLGAYPNPFNPRTDIAFELGEPGMVSLTIYDLSGRHVRTLARNKNFGAGSHSIPWIGDSDTGRWLASGVYFYRFEAAGLQRTGRLAMVK